MINIYSIGVFFPDSIVKIESLDNISEEAIRIGKNAGIKSINEPLPKDTVTEMGKIATERALENAGLEACELDQLVFISEGISDYLYMDTSKTIIKKIDPNADGAIHANDFFKGFNGTITLMELVNNQLESNIDINYSAICTSLNWKYHSRNRIIGDTILGNGAGTVILSKKAFGNEILATSSVNLSQFNLVAGFKYGGTSDEISTEVINNNLFHIDILNKSHLVELQKNYEAASQKVIDDVLSKSKLTINQIDYIGIASTGMHIINLFKKRLPENCKILFSIQERGYLGSLGIIELLHSFINNDKIEKNSVMLLFSVGIDSNFESLIIRK